MGNTRADNQWNGKGMEQAINIVYNKYPRINPNPNKSVIKSGSFY